MNRAEAWERALTRCALALLVIALAAPAVAATGGLLVTVYEFDKETEERSLLPGATVILSEPNGQLQQMVQITGPDGNANFPVIPVGSTYTIQVAMPGYQTVVLTDQRVLADQVVPVSVALVSELQEEVTVSARQNVVELDEGTTSQTEISEELFEDLPVLGRQYQNILSVAAGVQDSDGDGNPNVHGSREQDFQMMVDGISNVDPLTGEIMSEINPDAIEEIEIVDSGADASFGGAVGGFGRISYKQGGNEFEGSLIFQYADSIFDNDGAGDRNPTDFRLLAPSIYLSGPIIKDKLWFVASHELFRAETPVSIIGGPDFTQEVRRYRNFDRLTWQVNGKNKLQLNYQADPASGEPFGVNTQTPAASGYRLEVGGPTVSLKWTNTFSGSLFFEAVAGYSDIVNKTRPFDPDARNNCVDAANPAQRFLVDNQTSYCVDNRLDSLGLRSGAYPIDSDDERTRWTYSLSAEKFISDFLGGTHKVKFGFSFERAGYERSITRDVVLRYGDVPGASLGGNFPVAFGSVQTFFPRSQTSSSRGNYYALYLSDAWDVRPNLVITAGVRWTREELSSDGYTPIDLDSERSAFDSDVAECIAGGSSPAFCTRLHVNNFTRHQLDVPVRTCATETGVVNVDICNRLQLIARGFIEDNPRESERYTITNNDIEPRISVSWDPWNDGKTKIAGSWGRFYGNTFLAPLVSELGPDLTSFRYNIDQSGNPIFNAPSLTAFSISEIDRDLERQYTDEWTVRFERELAPETSLIARYVNRRYRNQFQDIDANRRPVFYDDLSDAQLFGTGRNQYGDGTGGTRCVRIGEFADCTGRQIVEEAFDGPKLVEAPDGFADVTTISPLFSSIYKIGNYNESEYEAYILEIVRRFYQNWEMRASYTWSESLGQAESFSSSLGDDATNSADEFGPLATDQRHVVTLFGRVFVPRWGGFRLGSTLTYQSGLPYSTIIQRDVLDVPNDQAPGNEYDDTVVYQTSRTLYRSRQRNDQRNEPFWTLNVNFQKEFNIKDVRTTVQFDVFNVLNDDSRQILYVQEFERVGDEGETFYERVPVSFRRFGRQFQLLLKANF